jgi:DNA-directed RNA polymerase specialized sigma24 family protein
MDAVPDGPREDATWSTIARAADGDMVARESFGRTYLPVVRSLLEARWRRTALADEVDDAVQEVFVECLRRDGVLSRADAARGDLRGLLFGVARNIAARFEERARERLGRDGAAASGLDQVEAREPSLSLVFDRAWARTLLRLAGERMRAHAELGDAGARLRIELLRLRFGEGIPLRDIAAQWEMDPDAVYRSYGKARAEFRACLRRIVAEQAVSFEADLDTEVRRILELLA